MPFPVCDFPHYFPFIFHLANLLSVVPDEEHPDLVNNSSPEEERNQFPGIFGKNLLLLLIVVGF